MKPIDIKLYNKVKQYADKIYTKPSAYKSGFIIKEYKKLGGEFKNDHKSKNLKRWFNEKWVDLTDDKQYPVMRPSIRINKKTPLTVDEIDKNDLKKQIKLKQKLKGNYNLPKFKKKQFKGGGSGNTNNARATMIENLGRLMLDSTIFLQSLTNNINDNDDLQIINDLTTRFNELLQEFGNSHNLNLNELENLEERIINFRIDLTDTYNNFTEIHPAEAIIPSQQLADAIIVNSPHSSVANNSENSSLYDLSDNEEEGGNINNSFMYYYLLK